MWAPSLPVTSCSLGLNDYEADECYFVGHDHFLPDRSKSSFTVDFLLDAANNLADKVSLSKLRREYKD
jgi:hypothetical protein